MWYNHIIGGTNGMLPMEIISVLAKRRRIDVIRTLKAHPEKEFTINELARIADVPAMTAWRAIKELKAVRIVTTRRIGNAISVKMTDDRERLRALRLIPETDPQRTAAVIFAKRIGEAGWVRECRLFGSIGKGEHGPGDDVDVAVVFEDGSVTAEDASARSLAIAGQIKSETNVNVVPLCIPSREMARKGGLAAELRDKEVILRK